MDFLIETKHTPEACLSSLDEILKYNPKFLEKIYLGCKSGVHEGWAEVKAGSKSEALETYIPVKLRADARVIKVGRFTADQIRAMHK
jgi:hypothetical protein